MFSRRKNDDATAQNNGSGRFDSDVERQQSTTLSRRYPSMSFAILQRRQHQQSRTGSIATSDMPASGSSSTPFWKASADRTSGGLMQPLLQDNATNDQSNGGPGIVGTSRRLEEREQMRHEDRIVTFRQVVDAVSTAGRQRGAAAGGLMRRSSAPVTLVDIPNLTSVQKSSPGYSGGPFCIVDSHNKGSGRGYPEQPVASSQWNRLWSAMGLRRGDGSHAKVAYPIDTCVDGQGQTQPEHEPEHTQGSRPEATDFLGSLTPMRSPHSATLALLHTKFHNYGRGPVKANVLRHNVAGDLILPSSSLVKPHGLAKSNVLTPRTGLSTEQISGMENHLDASNTRHASRWAPWTKHVWGFGGFVTLLVAGLWLLLEHKHMEDMLGMQLWRWALWGATSLGLALTSGIVADASVLACEHWSHDQKMDFLYIFLLRLLQCASLFFAVQLIKVAVARGASTVFYRSSFFGTIYDAVIKEHFLQRLAEPCSTAAWENTNDNTGTTDNLTSERKAEPSTVQVAAMRSASVMQPPAVAPRNLRKAPSERTRRAPSAVKRGMRKSPSLNVTSLGVAHPLPVSLQNRDSMDSTQSGHLGRTASSQLSALTGGAKFAHSSKSRGGNMEKALLKLQQSNSLGVGSSVADVMLSDKVCKALSSEAEICPKQVAADARQAALYIFWNLKSEFDATCITRGDLERVLQVHEAARFMELLHLSKGETITLPTLKKAVLEVYQDRHKLALQLSDRNSISGLLESLLGVLLHSISILVYLYIFNVDLSSMWIALSSVMLAMSFVFGNSMRGMFESTLYLLVVNAFDVGDVIELNGSSTYKVEAINLMVATLLHSDGQRVYYPIPALAAAPLSNLSRSQHRSETLRMTADRLGLDCGAAVHEIQSCMRALADGGTCVITTPWQVSLAPNQIPTKVDILLRFTLRLTGEDSLAVDAARGVIIGKLGECLDSLRVRYSLPPQAVHKIKSL